MGGAMVATSLMDVTGLAATGALALGGLYLLPLQRRRMKTQLRGRVHEIRQDLETGISTHLNHELDRVELRLKDTLEPFERNLRVHQEQIARQQSELRAVSDSFSAVQRYVDSLETKTNDGDDAHDHRQLD